MPSNSVPQVLPQRSNDTGNPTRHPWCSCPLKKEGAGGGPEDGVVEGVALFDLVFDFEVEVVGLVFGFPVAAGELVLVAEGAVGDDAGFIAEGADFFAELGDSGPLEGTGEVGEEGLEG